MIFVAHHYKRSSPFQAGVKTANPDVMDIQRDHGIQEGVMAVTTLSLAQTQISRIFVLDSLLLYTLSQVILKIQSKVK